MNQPDPSILRLRKKVLDELALVQGRIALAQTLTGDAAKEQLRLAHGSQREARLADAAEFLVNREDVLIREFADGKDIDPQAIDPLIIPVRTPAEADLFRFATLQWSVPVSSGYGRRSRFLVRDRQNGKLMAIFALGDPVIAQAARDSAVGWDVKARNKRLYNVFDAFVLGAVEPYRQLLGGKLAALLTLSNETRDFLRRKYAGNMTTIREETKDPTPILITTSSALGRSSVYNRITYRKQLMFHSVGFTRGFGHFQFSDELFAELLDFARGRSQYSGISSARAHSTEYGKGPNWRFRVLRTALEDLDIPEESLQHNLRREVFLAPVANNWDLFLRGDERTPELLDLPAESLGEWWRERWAVPRADRRPQYRFWHHDEARVSPQLRERPFQLTLGQVSPYGRIEMGGFHLAVGVRKVEFGGKTATNVASDGSAYQTRLEAQNLDLTISDVTWTTGEREVRGQTVRRGDEILAQVVGKLPMVVTPSERFRDMSVLELQLAVVSKETGQVELRETSAEELSDLLGFDFAAVLDELGEASVGTRGDLLKDDGPGRSELCAVFRPSETVVPAVAWTLTRVAPLLAAVRPWEPRPTRPVLKRPAPRPVDLQPESRDGKA